MQPTQTNMPKTIVGLFAIMSSRQKIWLVVLFFTVILASLFQMLTVGSIPLVVSALQSPEVIKEHRLYDVSSQMIDLEGIEIVDLAILGLVIVFVSANVSRVAVLYLRSRIVRDFTVDLSERLFNHYIAAPYTYHLGTNTANAIRNLNNEVPMAVSNFSQIVTLAMAFLTIVFIIGLLLWQNFVLALFVLLAGAVSSIFVFGLNRRVSTRMGKVVHIEQAHMLKVINHTFGGIRDIHILNRIGRFGDLFSDSVHKFCQAKFYQAVVSGVVQPLIQSAGLLALMLIVFFAYISEGGMSQHLPTIALFGAAMHRLLPNLSELVSNAGKLYYNLAGTKAVVDEITEFKRQEEEHIASLPSDYDGEPVHYDKVIGLDNVTYIYPSAEKASLNGINLKCFRGEMIGLVGETGSGKSTIVDIIMGLLPPTTGRVFIDGADVSSIRNRWCGTIGMVSQSVFLMDETIRANVTMGLPEDEIDDVRVWRALELAQIDHVIKDLPDELDALVGERGVRLSGGERQRIVLARALYCEPSILIMDEGTSALDNQTERKLMEAIKSLRANYTIIVIAHRLSSVMDCDRLYLIDDGKVVASGRYEDLLTKSDQFHALATAQTHDEKI